MSDYVEFVREILEPFGDVRARRMFGGYGLYHRDQMFGLIANDALYLKANARSAHWFLERGLDQFEYMRKGKPTKLSYYAAPEEMFDDPDEAVRWATRAFDAVPRRR